MREDVVDQSQCKESSTKSKRLKSPLATNSCSATSTNVGDIGKCTYAIHTTINYDTASKDL